jgi:hypothetical protein
MLPSLESGCPNLFEIVQSAAECKVAVRTATMHVDRLVVARGADLAEQYLLFLIPELKGKELE